MDLYTYKINWVLWLCQVKETFSKMYCITKDQNITRTNKISQEQDNNVKIQQGYMGKYERRED